MQKFTNGQHAEKVCIEYSLTNETSISERQQKDCKSQRSKRTNVKQRLLNMIGQLNS